MGDLPCTNPNIDPMLACFPDDEQRCGFTSAATDQDALTMYSSHASSAASWWAEHSSAAMEVAEACLSAWYDAMWDNPLADGGAWALKMTISDAQCWEKMSAGAVTTGEDAASASTAKPESSGADGQGATGTPEADSAGMRLGGYGLVSGQVAAVAVVLVTMGSMS